MLGFDLGWSGLGGFGTRFGPQVTLGSSARVVPSFTVSSAGWDSIQLSQTFQAARAYQQARDNITASRELPGRTHYDPNAAVPVGQAGGGSPSSDGVVRFPGIGLPQVGIFTPDFQNEGQPPIIYSPPPILLPGQVDPGREEQESEEGPMAHTWTHVGSQFIGALFPSAVAQPAGFAPGASGLLPPGDRMVPTGTIVEQTDFGTRSCPPMKTRTLTIDCATGLEIKRKRRRRRALLTQGDMGVLFQIASLPNNANVRVALAGAIRR